MEAVWRQQRFLILLALVPTEPRIVPDTQMLNMCLKKIMSGCLYVKCLGEGLTQDNHVTTLVITITIKMQKSILNWYRWIKILDYFPLK